ncbi:N-acetylmuramoyl-L-alanine amidase [Actinomyces faecalis]|uniref:N-acetylmuramoyl-L-alanine amidase n=1 Tax=Actinomyces faecalis TaxID=2722820 RepID=UPI001555E7AC|nr:N-acetylmuramoyl-L-alanine amidase [Actinomyces faecalis]
MSASRYLRAAVAISIALAGIGQVDAAQAHSVPVHAGPAPVQLLELTTSGGQTTELASAGLGQDPVEASRDSVPAGTTEGHGVAPARAVALAAATEAPDLEQDADLLTEPLEVDSFLVAGFTWTGSKDLPTGTQIYLRARENGVWSSWYLNETADAGPDDAPGSGGTDEFVTGGADAIQAAVVSGGRELPADLTLALVPAQPAGQEVLSKEDVTTTQAEPTEVAPETAVAQPQPEDRLMNAEQSAEPVSQGAAPGGAVGSMVPASISAGSGVTPGLPAVLAATTTMNGLPVPVVTRAEWGANQASMTWSPTYANAAHVVVHHTAGTNSYSAAQSASIVAAIYHYHAVVLDWGDIGYNFLVDKYGQVFEGRYGTLSSAAGKMVVGGHARGANTGTMGISMMGNYVSTSPTEVQLDRVGKLAGWFLTRSGVTNALASAPFTILATEKYKAGQVVDLPRILAHRDVGYTLCPGDMGYSKMGQIRAIAQSQIRSGGESAPTPTPSIPSWELDGGRWYLRGADGAHLTGWQRVTGSWYYLAPGSGAMVTGWLNQGGTWYYLGASGAMATGWAKVGGQWYYLASSGAMATGWAKVSGQWYYLSPDSGAMVTGWLNQAGTWYYLGASGAMATGWAKVGGQWYYMLPGGSAVTGWQQVGGTWYYFKPDSAMVVGWAQIKGRWYYFNASGHMVTGWLALNGTWYYLGASGAMVTGTQQIDGRYSVFSSSGAWQGYTTEAAALGLHEVMSKPVRSRSTTISAMVAAYQSSGRTYPSAALAVGGAPTITGFATQVYDEAVAEGVSPELLFVQVVKETGWLQFGGDVKIGQFNFGGLGATGGGNPGNSFPDVRTGLRAQVQHLRAYADPSVTAAALSHPVVDTRFAYVRKGSARYVEHLGIQENPNRTGWAMAKGYGADLVEMMRTYFSLLG